MKRDLPPTPVFDSYLEKYGSLEVFDMFFDENMELLPDAPEDLRKDIDTLQQEKRVRLP